MDQYLGEIRMFSGDFAPEGWAPCDGQALPISAHEALYALIGTTYGGDGKATFNLPDLRGRVPIHVGQGNSLGSVGEAETVAVCTPAQGNKPNGRQMPNRAVHFIIALNGARPYPNWEEQPVEHYIGEIRIFPFDFVPHGWEACNGQLLPTSQNQTLYATIGSTYGGDWMMKFALPDLRGRAPLHAGQIPLGKSSSEQTQVPTQHASAGGAAGGSVPHSNLQPYLTLNFCIAPAGNWPADLPYGLIGEIRILAGLRAPPSWPRCDGQLLKVEEPNLELYSIVFTTLWVDNRTFRTPDLRDRTPVHRGQGPGPPSQPQSNQPPFLALNFIIALKGEYPYRP